jgi:hypothetical protein
MYTMWDPHEEELKLMVADMDVTCNVTWCGGTVGYSFGIQKMYVLEMQLKCFLFLFV